MLSVYPKFAMIYFHQYLWDHFITLPLIGKPNNFYTSSSVTVHSTVRRWIVCVCLKSLLLLKSKNKLCMNDICLKFNEMAEFSTLQIWFNLFVMCNITMDMSAKIGRVLTKISIKIQISIYGKL